MRRHWLYPAAALWLAVTGFSFWQWCEWCDGIVLRVCVGRPCPAPLDPVPLPWTSTAVAVGLTVTLGFLLYRQRWWAALQWLPLLGAVPPVLELLFQVTVSGGLGAVASLGGFVALLVAELLAAALAVILGFALLWLGAAPARLTRRDRTAG